MKKRYLIVLSLITTLVMLTGAFSVMAQDDTTTPPAFPGRGFGMRGGNNMGWGNRGWGGPAEGSMINVVAEKLDMTIEELWAEFQAGKTMAELVEEKGLEMQDITDAFLSNRAEYLATQVEAGYLTQEQADAMQALMSANMETHLSADGTGFYAGNYGFGPGGRMGQRGGRMGQHGGRGFGFPWQ